MHFAASFLAAASGIDVFSAGRGVFCIDVKDWQGEVTQHKGKWHVIPKKEDTSVHQFADPIQAIKVKQLSASWSENDQ